MGVMDRLFGSAGGGTGNNGPQPAPLPAAPVAAPVAATPAAPSPSAAPAVPDSPLDAFATFWQTPVGEDGKPRAPAVDPLTLAPITLDATKISEQIAGLDFTGDIKPELLTAFVGEDQAKQVAFRELLNAVGQAGFKAATLNTGHMVNNAVLANNKAVTGHLATSIRRTQLADTPIDNPVLQHPAAQPLVIALRQAAQNRDPNASPAEVAKSVDNLFMGLAEALQATTPAAKAVAATAASNKVDWDKMLS